MKCAIDGCSRDATPGFRRCEPCSNGAHPPSLAVEPLSAPDLAALRAMLDAASPLPWTAHEYVAPDYAYGLVKDRKGRLLMESGIRANAHAVVAVMNAAPTILDALAAHVESDTLAADLAVKLANVTAERDEARSRCDTLDAIDALVGVVDCPWEYPGQVVRDVKAVVEARDAAIARAETAEGALAQLRASPGLAAAVAVHGDPLAGTVGTINPADAATEGR